MITDDEIKTGLGPRVMLAVMGGDHGQWNALLADHRPIDIIGSLAATLGALALEMYGSHEHAKAVFAGMALAADVDEVLAEPMAQYGAECAAEVAELEAEQVWDATDELAQYGPDPKVEGDPA